MNMARCMGIKKFEAKCQICRRLPRTISEEEWGVWITPKKGIFCSEFLPFKEPQKEEQNEL